MTYATENIIRRSVCGTGTLLDLTVPALFSVDEPRLLLFIMFKRCFYKYSCIGCSVYSLTVITTLSEKYMYSEYLIHVLVNSFIQRNM